MNKVTDMARWRAAHARPITDACRWSEAIETIWATNLHAVFSCQRMVLRLWGVQ